jgi:hypothetical protein
LAFWYVFPALVSFTKKNLATLSGIAEHLEGTRSSQTKEAKMRLKFSCRRVDEFLAQAAFLNPPKMKCDPEEYQDHMLLVFSDARSIKKPNKTCFLLLEKTCK